MSPHDPYRFRLYVTGIAPNSVRALANLAEFCRTHLPDCHQIEIVDLNAVPSRALSDGVYVTPTLVRVAPGPEVRVVGNLSVVPPLLFSLGPRKD
jgi:circadian clock protein KaiB